MQLSLVEAQEAVRQMVEKYKLEIIPELRYIDLTSEVGELGKEILKSTEYGTEGFTKTENMESEIGDVLFSLICIANTLGINLEKSLIDSMEKYQKRFDKKGNIGSGN